MRIIAAAILALDVLAIAQNTLAATPLQVAFIVGEDEYHTWETLPVFAERNLKPLGIDSIFIFADEKTPNHFPNIEKIDHADVLLLSVRRRPMSREEMSHVRKFLAAGKPVVAVRTACHGFAPKQGAKNSSDPNLDAWPDFDVQVLGGRYTGHYTNQEGAEVNAAPDARKNPILVGTKMASFHSGGTLYKCGELDDKTVVLLTGTATDQGKSVTHPVAWTHEFGKSRVFFTSLGHPDDFKNPAFNTMLVNALLWAANRTSPIE